MTTDIICAGFGGQGVLTVGMILASAGMKTGRHVTWYPSYGSEMRGGTANCTVRFGDEAIASPYAKTLDLLFAMSGPAVDKFEARLKPGGLLLVNTSIAKERRTHRGDIRARLVPAAEIAEGVPNGSARGANMVMLGVFCKETGLFPPDAFIRLIDEYFEEHGKKNPQNAVYFMAGYNT